MCGSKNGRYFRQCSGERRGEGGDLGVRMCRVLAVGFVVGCSSWYVRSSSLYDTLDPVISISYQCLHDLCHSGAKSPKRVVHVAVCDVCGRKFVISRI
jgi:hypothetical protein